MDTLFAGRMPTTNTSTWHVNEGRLQVHSMLAVLPQKWTIYLLESLTLSDSGPMNLWDQDPNRNEKT